MPSSTPPRDREAYNAYHRVYQLRRYHQRMERFRAMLGGKCTKCGATEDLEIDHIDPASKDKPVSRAWQWNDEAVLAELEKCQLLCEICHVAKHASPHGSIRRYKNHGCRCQHCKAAITAYNREYHKRRLAQRRAPSS